jgi:hypothetical protein
MIKAWFERGKAGSIRAFKVHGHAGFASHGEDVVCAAVSMLVINTLNSIETLLPLEAEKMYVSSDEDSGDISCRFSTDPSSHAAILLEALYLGLKTVEEDYDGRYLRLMDKEEKGG